MLTDQLFSGAHSQVPHINRSLIGQNSFPIIGSSSHSLQHLAELGQGHAVVDELNVPILVLRQAYFALKLDEL